METSESDGHEIESEGHEIQPSPEPWVYRPGLWDQQELHELYERNPLPTSVPEEIAVTLVGEDGNTTSLNLIATKTSFRISDTELNYRNIRYVTTNCRALCSDAEMDRFVILMSTRWVTQEAAYDVDIYNIFIRPDSADSALAVLNFLQYHIYQFLKSETGQQDPSVLQQYISPLIVNEFEVRVHRENEEQTWEGKRILILDQECLALYSKPFEESPNELMFFWSEQHERSCAKMSRSERDESFLLQSRQLYISIVREQEMVPELEQAFHDTIKSMPKRAFEEPRILLQLLGGNCIPATQGFGEIAALYEWDPVVLDPAQMEMLDKLERELDQGLANIAIDHQPDLEQEVPTDSPPCVDKKSCKELTQGLDTDSISQLQTMWDNIRPNLAQEVLTESLPYVDEKLWMYDPSSVDDLMRVIRRIEEELFVKVDYSTALGTILAMQRFFLKTRVFRIGKLMEENHMDLLYKIFARGNVSFKKPYKASGVRPR